MHVTVVEPYETGSHGAWLAGLRRHSHHNIRAMSLPRRFWKWRMHGGTVSLGRMFNEGKGPIDLLMATDMLDLATFLGITRRWTSKLPTAVYFHENQLTYPLRPGKRRDLHYGFVNYTSALVADRVFFNSGYHREAFLEELPRLLKHFPDYNERGTIAEIEAKSVVLPLGLDLRRFDAYQPASRAPGPLRIVWNHRWEYDKMPGMFFEALYRLQEEGVSFEVIVLGESFRQRPGEFLEAHKWLGNQIRHFGYAEELATYACLLWEGDVQVSCAIQDFFGASTCEAMYCGPILPDRLNYPAFIPVEAQEICLYENFNELIERLRWAAQNVEEVRGMSLRGEAERYDWEYLIGEYDEALEKLVGG